METSLKVMWIGYGGHALYAEALRPLIEKLDISLITIHEWANANVRWNLNTWREELKKADVIILPTDVEKFPAKSNNKLTQAMSLGKPVICSPLPAYVEIEKKYPECCLFATNEDEWEEHLLRLRNSPDLRQEISKKALEASQDYHIDKIGAKWAKVFKNIGKPTPVVDLIIVNYNNVQYLKLCVDSILENTSYPFNLIISDAGSGEETWDYLNNLKQKYNNSLKSITIVGEKNIRKNYSEACNAGIKVSQALYFAILNSDLIVSDQWLNNIMDKFKDIPDLAACGVLSNCDKGWLF